MSHLSLSLAQWAESKEKMASKLNTIMIGSVANTLSYFAQIVATFFLMPFLVLALGDRLYGIWTLIGTFIGYYGLMDFGLGIAVNRHIAVAIGSGDKAECNRIFNTALRLYAIIGVFIFLVGLGCAGLSHVFIEQREDAELLRSLFVILSLSLAIEFPFKVFQGLLTAHLRYDIVSIVTTVTIGLRVGLIVFVVTMGYELIGMAWATFLASLPGKLIFLYFCKKLLPFVRLERRLIFMYETRKLFSFSVFSFIAKTANEVKFNLDYLVVGYFVSLSAVTHYKIAGALVEYARNLVSTMLMISFSHFSQQHGERNLVELKNSFYTYTKVATYITIFIAFGLILWGSAFIERWMGEDYLHAYPVLVVLVVATLIDLAQAPTSAILFATGNHKVYAGYVSVEAGLNLILSILLVRWYGLIGVAMGTLIPSILIRGIVQPLHLCKVLGFNRGEYAGQMIKSVGIAACGLILPLVMSVWFSEPNYGRLFALGISSSMAYLFVIWMVGVSSAEKEMIGRAGISLITIKKSIVAHCRWSKVRR